MIAYPDAPSRFKVAGLVTTFIVGLLFRLWGITHPLLDFHSWRQTDTASIARNFYTGGMNILNPRLDVLPGHEELGFPLYPYIVAVSYLLFGIHEYLGRLISVLFSMGSMWYLYLLTKKYYNDSIANLAILFLAILPISVYYTRTFQPESMMLFFSIAAIYFFSEWIDRGNLSNFSIAIICSSCAFLVKIPTLYMGLPMIVLSFMKYGRKIFFCRQLYFFVLLTIVPSLLWYWYDHKVFLEHLEPGSIWVYTDKWGDKDILLSFDFYKHIFLNRLSEKMFTFTLIPFLLIGLFSKVKKKEQYLFHAWFIGIIIYFFVVARGNYVHEYYQLPIIPVGCVFIGSALHQYFFINKNVTYKYGLLTYIVVAAVMFVPIYSILKLESRLKLNMNYLSIAKKIKSYSDGSDKIVVLGRGRPEVIYYSERKGWHTRDGSIETIEYYRQKGAKYLIISDINFRKEELKVWLNTHYNKLYEGDEGIIFQLGL